MYGKKQNVCQSPDLGQLQTVVVDHKTTIFIARDADPKEAKHRYLTRFDKKEQ